MKIYEGDLASIPTILPGEEELIPNIDDENTKEGIYWAELQDEVRQGWRDEQEAEELLWRWRNKRVETFGEAILRAS